MGLFNWSKKKEDIPIEDKGWIKVRIGFNLNGDIPKKEIISMFDKLSKNLKQGSFFFNKLDNSFGFGSPFVEEQNVIKKANFIETKHLSKSFITKIDREKDNWHITFTSSGSVLPVGSANLRINVSEEDNLYRLQELDEDLVILWQIDKYLKEKYNLEGNPCSFNTGFNGKKPTMEIKWSLMTYEFNVEDGLKYDSELTKKCFGVGVQERIDLIKKTKKKFLGDRKDVTTMVETEKWLSAVKKLTEKE